MSLSDALMSAFEIFEFVEAIDCNSNVSIDYRIQLIISMTIASAKRSSSKLNLLKNYLRLSMSQNMLRKIIEHIDVDTIISNFVSSDARRSCYVWEF